MKGNYGVLSCSYRYSSLNRQDYEFFEQSLKKGHLMQVASLS